VEVDCQDQRHILKNNQSAGTTFRFNRQQITKLPREELEIQGFVKNNNNLTLITSQLIWYQTEELHQQLLLFKNYLTKFLNFKASATEHNLEQGQKETRTQL